MRYSGMGLICAALLAFAPMANADLKLGYVNAARLLDESPQAQEVTKRLKQEFSGKESEILTRQQELKKQEERMVRDGAVMSESERGKLEHDISALKRDLQRSGDEFREDLNLRKNEEMNKLLAIVQQSIEGMGKEQNFDLIVYEGVAYASPAIDLTDKVLERMRAAGNAAPAATPSRK